MSGLVVNDLPTLESGSYNRTGAASAAPLSRNMGSYTFTWYVIPALSPLPPAHVKLCVGRTLPPRST